jgi:hypothetical protein
MRDLINRLTTDFSLLDRKAIFALIYTAVGLTAIFYLKNQESVSAALSGTTLEPLGEFIANSQSNNLPALGWWVAVVTVFYFVIPASAIRFLYRESLADYGLNLRIEPEFFFRGFLVHSLKPALGIYSIFAMTVPYCMIHFGKPPAETFAAIAAGVFLGWLSYRNGNIWMGLLLHCTVAFSMDIMALYNKGLLF